MAKAPDKTGEGRSAEPTDSDRLADGLKDMPAVPLHPLMAHPTAAFAAATAIGFGLATHMTSVFLGSLHGALEATGKLARKLEEEQAGDGAKGEDAATTDAAPTAVVADAKPLKEAKPRTTKAKAAKPTPLKPATPKPAATLKPAATAKLAATVKPTAARRSASAVMTEAPKKAAAVTVVKTAKTKGRADDLKRIEGIGPKLEQLLNARGIRRFADLAALDAGEIEALDTAIGLDGRALRDDWAGQARKLARGRE